MRAELIAFVREDWSVGLGTKPPLNFHLSLRLYRPGQFLCASPAAGRNGFVPTDGKHIIEDWPAVVISENCYAFCDPTDGGQIDWSVTHGLPRNARDVREITLDFFDRSGNPRSRKFVVSVPEKWEARALEILWRETAKCERINAPHPRCSPEAIFWSEINMFVENGRIFVLDRLGICTRVVALDASREALQAARPEALFLTPRCFIVQVQSGWRRYLLADGACDVTNMPTELCEQALAKDNEAFEKLRGLLPAASGST